jgi:hypothetical protein
VFDRFSAGQISASLAAMHRTIDDYDSMAKREMIKAKQEKARLCVHSSAFFLQGIFLFIPRQSGAKVSCRLCGSAKSV